MSFTEKVVIITGAGSGIGAATAIAFIKEGAQVVMVDKDETRLENVISKYEFDGKEPIKIKCDISVEKDAENVIDKTINTFKRLDVLVNAAGVFNFSNIFDQDLMDTYDEMMNVNLRATIRLTQLAVPYLIENKGNIVNVSSSMVSSVPGKQKFLCYGISKAALNYFSLDLAKELAPHGVRVNIVSPGPVRTNLLKHLELDDWWDKMKLLAALGRVSEPEEIAEVILFLAKAKGVHGSIYECDNGFK